MNRSRSIWIGLAGVAGGAIVILVVIGTYGNVWREPPNGQGNGNSNPDGNETDDGAGSGFQVLPDSDLPVVRDSALRVEKVIAGLANPTGMAFVGQDDMLVLEKNSGRVRLIADGRLQNSPILSLSVNDVNERGLLGIAVDRRDNATGETVFLYYTENDGEVRNRVYKYSWHPDGRLTEESLVLDLPGTPGPNHDGGKITIGPDGLLYAVIGDLNRNGMLQNYRGGSPPDDTAVIMRVDLSGRAAPGYVLSDSGDGIAGSLSRYHAYGIRNSFGIDFDPLTGKLWDTENGPAHGDEINIVEPGFNSGWRMIMGFPNSTRFDPDSELVDCLYCSTLTGFFDKLFNGYILGIKEGVYSDPEFVWQNPVAVTSIKFLDSDRLGTEYTNDIFVGDYVPGNLYHFDLNEERDALILEGPLADKVADNPGELESAIFGSGFRAITDLEVGEDGFLYVLEYEQNGSVYRIVPKGTPEPCVQ